MAETIKATGFRDGVRGLGCMTRLSISTKVLEGSCVLVLDVPEAELAPFERLEGFNPYREFLGPASVLNTYLIV